MMAMLEQAREHFVAEASDQNLDAVVEEFIVVFRADDEMIDAFTKILGKRHFSGTFGHAFKGTAQDAHEVECVARILERLGQIKGPIFSEGKVEAGQLGWRNLNRDAKGWAKALLTVVIADDAPPEVVASLCRAKTAIGRLINYKLDMDLRDSPPVEESQILLAEGLDS